MSKLPRPFDAWTTYDGHGGIDYPQASGVAVKASGSGLVDFSGWYSDRGGYAKFITYDNGDRHGYYHLRDLAGLPVGARVREGDSFGFVGSSGASTGPHLHHEVWRGGLLVKAPAYWDHVDKSRYVGQPTTAGGGGAPFPTGTQEGEPMFIAIVKGAWYLIVDQGSAKPRAVVLGSDSNAAKSGIPQITFNWENSITDLKSAVTGL